MTTTRNVSPAALLIAVFVALAVGILVSLAIRPPGAVRENDATSQSGGFEQVRWRVTSSFTSNLPIVGPPPQRIADNLRAMSNGAFQIKTFDPGEIVPALEITESVKEGKIQAGFQWLGYDQGRIPASTLISAVPFDFGGGRELGEALYEPHNVMPIVCSITSPETAGWFRKPVESLDDLVGLKIRFAGLGGKVLQRVGASVTMIPPAEIFQALEKGAIDATEFSMPVVDQLLGFSRVAKYNYFPGWHQTFSSGHLQVNLDEWNKLQSETQTMVRAACQASAMLSIAESEYLQGAVIRDFEEQGVITGTLSTEILEELRAVTQEVLDEEAAKDEQFARILKSQREFSATYRYWKTKGYLPRSF